METSLDERQIIDNEHLRMLRMAYFVSGAAAGFYGGMGLLYIALGTTMSRFAGSFPAAGSPYDASFPRSFFVIIGVLLVAFGAVVVLLRLYTARCLRQRRSLWLCYLTAALACLEIPWGTLLGVTTFVVLSRDSVRARFDSARP
jgi:hypothetical protein